MDTYKWSCINHWLATIESPQDPSHQGLWADDHLSLPGISTSPDAFNEQESPHDQVHDVSVAVRQEASTLNGLNGTSAQKKDHCYERRPRHKTKPDRYEYKGQSSVKGSHRSSSKPRKRLSRARKHTINDCFHASNVTVKRLSLRSCTPSGIFKKGKASSPVKTGLQRRFSVPVQAFSELDFLSHHPQPNSKEACNARDEDGADGSQEERTPPAKLAQGILYQNLSTQFEDTNEFPDMLTLAKSPVTYHQPKDQGLHNCKEMKYGGLYTPKHDGGRNYESDAAEPPSELFEAYTRQLLDFDLDAQPKAMDLVKKYVTLEGLKEILEEREEFGDKGTKGVSALEDQSENLDCRKRTRSWSIEAESDAGRPYKKQRTLPSTVETMAATERFYVPSHDFDLYSPTSGVDVSQQQAVIETPRLFPDLEGSSRAAEFESGLLDRASDVEEKLRCALRLNSTEQVCTDTFLTAYNMIMRDTNDCWEQQSSPDLSHEGSIWLVSGHGDAHDPMDTERQDSDVSGELEGFWRRYQLY